MIRPAGGALDAEEGIVDKDGIVEFIIDGAWDVRNDGCTDGIVEPRLEGIGDGGFTGTTGTLSELSPSSVIRGGLFAMSSDTYATVPNKKANDTSNTPMTTLFFLSPGCGSKVLGLLIQLNLLPRKLSSAHSTSRSGCSSLKSFQLYTMVDSLK